jgi:lysophospholipase L1-like esterase
MMGKDEYSVLLEEDSSGTRHNVPNMRYGKWEINSLGFRGKEIDLNKKEGQIRIACLGLSETFGVFESRGKEWPSQLGEMLRDEFPNVEVINVSVAGLKLKRRKDYVAKYVLPLKPDILVTTQGSLLPIMDLIRGLKGGRVKKKIGKRKMSERIFLRFEAIPKKLLPEWFLNRLVLWRLQRRIRSKERKHLVNKEPMDQVPENLVLEFENDLRSFIHYLKENRIIPVLLTYPCLPTLSNKELHKIILLSIRRLCVVLSEEGIIDASEKFNDVIRKISQEENLAFMDNDRLIPKTLEYFVDYSHYTNKGAEFIARNIYQFLKQSELIKEAVIHRDVEESL